MGNDKVVYADIGGTGERKGIIRENLEHIELLIFEPGATETECFEKPLGFNDLSNR